MSGPFNVGDVVVCVDDSPCINPEFFGLPFGFYRGEVGRVISVRNVRAGVALAFPNKPQRPGIAGFDAKRFRHLPKADEQFTAQIRACKPIRKGVPA